MLESLDEKAKLEKENDDLQQRVSDFQEELEISQRANDYYQKNMIPEIRK